MLSYELGSNNFTYNDTFGDMKFKNQQYYLEASSALLDVPEEWFYDMNTGDSIFSIEDLYLDLDLQMISSLFYWPSTSVKNIVF